MLWHADHLSFDRLLRFLEAELRRLHESRDPDYALMLEILYYMIQYADALHHKKEDIVFVRMKTRDPKLASLIDDLTRQHAQLHEIGEELARRLNEVLNGSIEPRELVERIGRRYIDTLRTHIRTEESTVLPLAARLLSDKDWSDVDAEIANFDDPVFGSREHDRYARLRQQINAHAECGHGR